MYIPFNLQDGFGSTPYCIIHKWIDKTNSRNIATINTGDGESGVGHYANIVHTVKKCYK